MKDRIRKIMESQHMTQQVFAQFIGMSAASLSSIFNGRTKPTINIVEAIKKKIPDISTDWLMFGSGAMYAGTSSPSDLPSEPSFTASEAVLNFDAPSSPTPPLSAAPSENVQPLALHVNGVKNTPRNLLREEVKIVDKPARRVTEIRIYYDDQTWESFVPSKK